MSLSLIFRVLYGILFFSSSSLAGLQTLEMPSPNAVIYGHSVYLQVKQCRKGRFSVRVNGVAVSTRWRKAAYRWRWWSRVELQDGFHRIEIKSRCPSGRETHRVDVTVKSKPDLATGLEVARNFMSKKRADRLSWNWDSAVFLHGLQLLSQSLGPASSWPLKDYLTRYHQRWSRKGFPRIDWSDECPSALSGLGLIRDDGNWVGASGIAAVVEYLRHAKRNRLGTLDHLGTDSPLTPFFPKSIWVDSLMMYGVFAAQWGRWTHDQEWIDFAARQPVAFAETMQDSKSGLFYHAWNLKKNRPLPRKNPFWLRGNGWVIAATIDILEAVGMNHPLAGNLKRIIRKLASGLVAYQLPSGLWDTVVQRPGKIYRETSGTLLVAYGLHKAVRLGVLDRSFLEPANRAYFGVTAILKKTKTGRSLPWVSWYTNPSSQFGYSLVPRLNDLSYGVGAYLMAASEFTQ